MDANTTPRKAIAVLRIEIRGGNDEVDMRALGARLGYAVDAHLVAIDADREGPLATVATALARTGADTVIVPDLEHIDGIDHHIRQRAQIITVAGERVIERAAA